jgi:hypothetical protein
MKIEKTIIAGQALGNENNMCINLEEAVKKE